MDLELMKVNLQLFAEGETEQEVSDTDEGVNENVSDSEDSTSEQETEQPAEQDKQDRVPLNKFLEEKKRRRDLERRLRELEEQNLSHETKEKTSKIRDLVKEKGYDEGVADLMADMFNEITKTIPKVDKVEQEILEDIQDFADENPEALKYKKEIIEKVKKYRKADPDFGVEDALNLIKPTKIRYSEIKTDVEQKQAVARRQVEGKKVATSSASSPANPYPLDEADRKALEGLQQMQPDKNWNAEKYYKSRYGK